MQQTALKSNCPFPPALVFKSRPKFPDWNSKTRIDPRSFAVEPRPMLKATRGRFCIAGIAGIAEIEKTCDWVLCGRVLNAGCLASRPFAPKQCPARSRCLCVGKGGG